MRKNPSRRSFLSALGLSAAGLALPKSVQAEPTSQQGVSGDFPYISIRDLYEMILVDPGLLGKLVNDLDLALAEMRVKLYPQCYDAVQALINTTKRKKLIEDLAKAIKENRWKDALRAPGTAWKWESACPWADCPV
jgi:hypothetical protein